LVSASVLPSSQNDIRDVFGESPFGSKHAYSYTYFENVASEYDTDGGGAQGVVISVVQLPTQDFAYDATTATTPWILSQKDNNDLRYELFRFHTIGHGNLYNRKYKIGISNVRAAGEDGSTDYAVFSVTLRTYGDTDKRKSVMETWNNVNLDPSSPRYIARVIGDRYFETDANGKITEFGDYSNKSLHIRVEVAKEGSFPISAAPFGHKAYELPIKTTASDSLIPAVVFQTGSANNTSSSPLYFAGFDYETTGVVIDNQQYLKPIPDGATTGANTLFAFDSQLTYKMTGSAAVDMVKRQFLVAFQGGFDGVNPTIPIAKAGDKDLNNVDIWGAANNQGFNCGTSTASGSVGYTKAINALSNPDEYDINLVAAPGINRELHPAITQRIIDMCEDRQDCFYIADFTDYDSDITTATEQANAVDSNYAACGQKTLQDKASALDRINVRRLLIAVKKFIASTSRYLVFEQNTSETRSRFINTVTPYLESIQQRQGLYAFNVVMDDTNNTPDVIDRNILAGAIFLQPTKTAEFIVIDFNILPTGASFSA